MLNKSKTCLLILPTNHNQDISLTLKISNLIEIIRELEKEKIEIKIATYRGNKPYLNFENDEKNRSWAVKNEDILLSVLNIDNISSNKFDAILIPSYLHIYEELKIPDHSLTKIILQFHKANKIICVYEHSTYVLCLSNDEEESTWPFVGYNLTGYSLANMMRTNMCGQVPFIIEEMVMLQGGSFISTDSLADDVVVVVDRNVVSGMDDNSLNLCLNNLVKKILL